MDVGEEIGRGVRSVVYAYGDGDAAKVPNADVPESWLREELRLTRAVRRTGAPVPRRSRIEMVAGSPALVVERISGPSMWQLYLAEPDRCDVLATQLAGLQVGFAALEASFELPAQHDRVVSKIHEAARCHGEDLLGVLAVMPPADGPLVLCHGDLHPRNVLLPVDDPRDAVVVDWFDASRGSLAAEVARTVIALEDTEETGIDRIGGLGHLVDAFVTAYLAAASRSVDRALIDRWLVVQGVARLAEGLGAGRLDGLRQRIASLGVR